MRNVNGGVLLALLQNSQRSGCWRFDGLIGVEAGRGGVTSNLFSSSELDPSQHVLPPKDNTACFLPLFQLPRNYLHKYSSMPPPPCLLGALLEVGGRRMEQPVQGLFGSLVFWLRSNMSQIESIDSDFVN